MEKKCLTVGAGDFFEKSLKINKEDFLISADGGIDSLLRIGLKPHLFVGDRDSSKIENIDTEALYFPPQKDDSDMLIAVKEGLKRGYRKFYIYGGTGGRCDHTVANIKVLEFLAENSSMGFLFFKDRVITVIKNDEFKLPSSFKGYFSVFPAGGDAEGVTIEGGEYELFDGTLKSSSSMGLSNDFVGKDVSIRVKKGSLMIIFERQGDYL